jgi:acetyl esterase/lipase
MGNPWLYRLVAVPFLEMGLAVAIVGYRTYPCGTIQEQILDLELASSELAQFYPELCQQPTELGVIVMGHSSGAHITLLMLSNWTRRKMELIEESIKQGGVGPDPDNLLPKPHMRVDLFVGISGPYNISHHFDYEASRGLEEISPLKATFYFTREEMLKHSPALRIVECMSHWSNECETRALDNILPRILFVHGIEDDIVPFTSSAEAASLLRSCGVSKLEEIYLASTIHNDCVVQLMTGGPVRDAVVDWLENVAKARQSEAGQTLVVRSRL